VAALGAAFSVVVAAAALLLALLNIREKVWPKPAKPHPLEAVLRDIAAAVRERAPDLHVRLGDVKE
jgi:hypothetical protein